LCADALYGFTVKSAALLVTLPEEAVMYVDWEAVTLCPVATPVLTIVAALVFEDVQVTESVITTVHPSSKIPVASDVWFSPDVMEAVVGPTAMD